MTAPPRTETTHAYGVQDLDWFIDQVNAEARRRRNRRFFDRRARALYGRGVVALCLAILFTLFIGTTTVAAGGLGGVAGAIWVVVALVLAAAGTALKYWSDAVKHETRYRTGLARSWRDGEIELRRRQAQRDREEREMRAREAARTVSTPLHTFLPDPQPVVITLAAADITEGARDDSGVPSRPVSVEVSDRRIVDPTHPTPAVVDQY